MTTIALIKECLLALKDRTGSSVPAMNKWIEANKGVSSFSESEMISFVWAFFANSRWPPEFFIELYVEFRGTGRPETHTVRSNSVNDTYAAGYVEFGLILMKLWRFFHNEVRSSPAYVDFLLEKCEAGKSTIACLFFPPNPLRPLLIPGCHPSSSFTERNQETCDESRPQKGTWYFYSFLVPVLHASLKNSPRIFHQHAGCGGWNTRPGQGLLQALS